MKDILAVLLGLAFAALNVVSIYHGKEWERTGTGWTWHLPVLLAGGGLAYVAMSYLSRDEASHVFVAFVDGALVIGTLAVLYWLFREPTSPMQWAGVAAGVVGLMLIAFGRPMSPRADATSEQAVLDTEVALSNPWHAPQSQGRNFEVGDD
jgi:drug/metabolite transporter (DMT)-like permease